MQISSSAIDEFRPPTDIFHLRMYYSLHITNLMSIIDMMSEFYQEPFSVEESRALATSKHSGRDILGYTRELRNSIVHRGVDLIAAGQVVDGLVRPVAPPEVWDRDRKRSYAAPTYLLRDLLIHCEVATKSTIALFVQPNLDNAALADSAAFQGTLEVIGANPVVPEWARNVAAEHLTAEMLSDAKKGQIKKLKRLLEPWSGQLIA
jgi:hypothetical protein